MKKRLLRKRIQTGGVYLGLDTLRVKIIMPLCGLLKGGFDHDRRDLESGIYTEPRAVLA